MILVPKNWASFQHYKDRNPPWVKLHKGLLDDRQYQRLPVASRALSPMLWLLASESKDGAFDGSIDELCFRLRANEDEIRAGLQPLIDSGFFLPTNAAGDAQTPVAASMQAPGDQVAIAALAACPQVAVPETETEATRKPRAVSREISLAQYLERCRAENTKPIPDDHPIRAYCVAAGITDDMRQIAWLVFKDRHQTNPKAKKYIDWSAAFANSVKDRWYRLWNVNTEGFADWSPTGLQEKRVIETRMNDKKEPGYASA